MTPSAYASSSKVTLSNGHTNRPPPSESSSHSQTKRTAPEQSSEEDEEGEILASSLPVPSDVRHLPRHPVRSPSARLSPSLHALQSDRLPRAAAHHTDISPPAPSPRLASSRSSKEVSRSKRSSHESSHRRIPDWRRSPSPPPRYSHRYRSPSPPARQSHRFRSPSPPPRNSHRYRSPSPPAHQSYRHRSPTLRDNYNNRQDRNRSPHRSSGRDREDARRSSRKGRDIDEDDYQAVQRREARDYLHHSARGRDRERDRLRRSDARELESSHNRIDIYRTSQVPKERSCSREDGRESKAEARALKRDGRERADARRLREPSPLARRHRSRSPAAGGSAAIRPRPLEDSLSSPPIHVNGQESSSSDRLESSPKLAFGKGAGHAREHPVSLVPLGSKDSRTESAAVATGDNTRKIAQTECNLQPSATEASSGAVHSRTKSRWTKLGSSDAMSLEARADGQAVASTSAAPRASFTAPEQIGMGSRGEMQTTTSTTLKTIPTGPRALMMSVQTLPAAALSAPITTAPLSRASSASIHLEHSPRASAAAPPVVDLQPCPPPLEELQPHPNPPPAPPAPPAEPLLPSAQGPSDKPFEWATVSPSQESGAASVMPSRKSIRDEIATSGSDPRRDVSKWRKNVERSKRSHRSSLVIPMWKWDKHSVGPKPPPPARGVLVTGLSPLTSISTLLAHFRQFGRSGQTELKMDPRTGESLGIYWHEFAHDFQESADTEDDGPLKDGVSPPGQHGHSCAMSAIESTKGRPIGMSTHAIIPRIQLCARRDDYAQAYRAVLREKDQKRSKQVSSVEPTRQLSGDQRAATNSTADSPLYAGPSPLNGTNARSGVNNQHRAGYAALSTQIGSSSPYSPVSAGRSPLPGHVHAHLGRRALAHREETSRADHSANGQGRRFLGGSNLAGRSETKAQATIGNGINGTDSTQMILAQLAMLGYPYLFFPHSRGGKADYDLSEVKQRFQTRTHRFTACDEHGWYIGFDTEDSASRSKLAFDKGRHAELLSVDLQIRQPADMTDEMHSLLDERQHEHEQGLSDPSTSSKLPIDDDRWTTTAAASELAAPAHFGPDQITAHRRMTQGYTEKELREEAEKIILRDLVDGLRRDCRNRITGAHVADFLRPDAPGGKALGAALQAANEIEAARQSAYQSNALARADAVDYKASESERLPSFRRRRQPSPPVSAARYLPRHGFEIIDEAMLVERGRKAREAFGREVSAGVSSMSPTLVSPAAAEEVQDDEEEASTAADAEEDKGLPQVAQSLAGERKIGKGKKGVKSRPAKAIIYSSDEESQQASEAEQVDIDERPLTEKVTLSSAAFNRKGSKAKKASKAKKQRDDESLSTPLPPKAIKAKAKAKAKGECGGLTIRAELTPASATPELVEVSESASLQDKVKAEEAALSTLAHSTLKKAKGFKSVKASVQIAEPIDPYINGLAEDEEDLYYLQQALERLRAGETVTPASLPDDAEEVDEVMGREGSLALEHAVPVHQSGSARTEGFYKIPPAQKAAHLPDRNKAIAETTTNVTLASARDNRADSRRLVLGIEQHKKDTASDTDILKFNQLRTRKKQLKFAKSPIHDWGLYAMEYIPANDMVIEYVGEVVRQQVADHREKVYEKQGNFSTYLFRVDDDLVVDATHKGNIARLMNHCCVPNCSAKILTLNGQKRIVLYAKQPIWPGQELTYDYKFQASGDEEDAITCLCGADGCRRFL